MAPHSPKWSRTTGWDVVPHRYPPVSAQKANNMYLRFFKFLWRAVRYGGVSACLLGQNQYKWSKININGQFLRANLNIKETILPPKNLAPLLDSTFNVNYDFAIKQDPIQSDNWVMDYRVMSKSYWAFKISTYFTKAFHDSRLCP